MADQATHLYIRLLNASLRGDAEYEALVDRYLSALVEQGITFQSPGPGSPSRWILHGIEYKLAPQLRRPPGYDFEQIGEKVDAALSDLAALLENRLPEFIAKREAKEGQ